MISLSDGTLSLLHTWLQWISIVGIGLGLLSGVGLIFVRKELSDRQAKSLHAAIATQQQLAQTLDTAQQELAESRKEVASVKERMAGRTLTTEQTQQLLSGLRACAGSTVTFSVPSGNAEALNFATELRQVFLDAGWQSPLVGLALLPVRIVGIVIHANSASQHPCAGVVQHALRSISFDAKGEVAEGYPSDAVEIFVGEKP